MQPKNEYLLRFSATYLASTLYFHNFTIYKSTKF